MPVQDFPVTFSTFFGDNLIEEDTLSTAINGQAGFTLTLGLNPGRINVTATAKGLAGSPIHFSANAALRASPTIDVQPSSHDFGEIVIGDSVSKSFVVSNSGAKDLSVSNIVFASLDTLDFDLVNWVAPFTLLHGDSQEVVVQFKPNSEGLKETRLRFESNDTSATTLDVTLNGIGVIPIPEIVVSPTTNINPTPENADDPAIWIHPTDPGRSVIIGTDKIAGIYVWDMNGNELQNIPQGTTLKNVDVRQNVSLSGQTVDIVAANLRDAGKLAVFKVNPNYSGSDVLIQIANVNSANNDIQNDSYGFCLYKRPSDNTLFVFERPKTTGQLRQYHIQSDSAVTEITVTPVRDLEYNSNTVEGFVADDELGFVYITEEEVGIHKYFADPNMGTQALTPFSTTDGIESGREGLALYPCDNGTGYLVLSSQGNSTIKIYERQNNNRFVKTVIPLNNQGGIRIATDGLDVTPFAAPPNFPNGFLVVHDQDGKRFLLYDWAQIAEDDLTTCVDGIIQQPNAQIAVQPSSLDFGEVFIDSSATKHFNVMNIGEAVLSVTSLTLNGEHQTEFSIESNSDTLTIAPGDTHQVTVAFQPPSEGEKNATVLIESNDPDTSSLTVTLTGSGKANVPVAIGPDPRTQLPERITLKPNYPNPFNIETTFEYELPERAEVRLVIYNLLGQATRKLVDETESPGVKQVRWNGKNSQGQEVGSGIYYVELVVNGKSLLRKITLLK
ncbi:phytase [candidate division KSB1 bacterium]|nr:phytase [candidate division KSB1 bacterium]NIS26802.1 phytase [candidate division KSB1 bacterium]NIT73596.1 phytase [candidate division KSB1 bacterium]NIU27472.1 phytase [candidate division KSB1 bacterium]NIW71871.1 phytase [candidate division KSB1 bacterium]